MWVVYEQTIKASVAMMWRFDQNGREPLKVGVAKRKFFSALRTQLLDNPPFKILDPSLCEIDLLELAASYTSL